MCIKKRGGPGTWEDQLSPQEGNHAEDKGDRVNKSPGDVELTTATTASSLERGHKARWLRGTGERVYDEVNWEG